MRKSFVLVLSVLLLFSWCIGMVAAVGQSGYVDVPDKNDYEAGNRAASFVNQDPDPVEPGQLVDVRWKVSTVSGTIDDLVIAVDPKYPFTLDPSTPRYVYLGRTDSASYGKDAYVVRYRLLVDKDAAQGDHRIDLRYSKDGGKTWAVLDPFYVTVRVKSPTLVIGDVSMSPQRVNPGSESVMAVEVRNEANAHLKDVRVVLGLKEASVPFAPLGVGNEQVIRSLDPGQSGTVRFSLITQSDAQAGIYKVPIEVHYADSLGSEFSKQMLTAIVVGDDPDLVVTAEPTGLVSAGSRVAINVRFINRGPTGIKFLYAVLKQSPQYRILSNPQAYVGEVDSDDYQTADFTLFVKEDVRGSLVLPIDITYSDATNREYSVVENVEMPVFSQGDIKKYSGNGSSLLIGVMIVVAIVVVGVVIYFVMRRRKAR